MPFMAPPPLKGNLVPILEGSSIKEFVDISKPQQKGSVWEANSGGEGIRTQHIEANMWKDFESGELDFFVYC